MNRIKKAFDNIKAEDSLKEETFEHVINGDRKKNIRFKKTFGLAVAALVLIVLGSRYYSNSTEPVTYISIDVNPSIELEINKSNRVIGAKAYNEEGNKILTTIDFKNKDYIEVVEGIMNNSDIEEYASKGEEFLFTVVSEDDEEIIKAIENSRGYKKVNGECRSTDDTTMKKAHDEKMSVGRYCKYVDAKKAGSNITVEDSKHMTIKELNKLCDDESEHDQKMENRGHHD